MRRRGATRPEDLYDFVYSWKDYAGEAAGVRTILTECGAVSYTHLTLPTSG